MQAHRVLEAHRVPKLLLRTLLGLLLLSLASPAAAFSQLADQSVGRIHGISWQISAYRSLAPVYVC